MANSEEPFCPYCVVDSVGGPKYVAALPDREMECSVSCHEENGPQCLCYEKDASIIYWNQFYF